MRMLLLRHLIRIFTFCLFIFIPIWKLFNNDIVVYRENKGPFFHDKEAAPGAMYSTELSDICLTF